jgi:hypothetical protein
MSTILAIDLGKFKSVACRYAGGATGTYQTVPTRPEALHDLIVAEAPDRVVINPVRPVRCTRAGGGGGRSIRR